MPSGIGIRDPGADRDLLGESTPPGRREDAIADGDAVDTRADRAHDAGDLGAGGEGERGLELVQVLDDEDVGEVHRARLDVHDHLPVSRGRIVDVLDDERLGRSVLLAEDCAHGGNLATGVPTASEAASDDSQMSFMSLSRHSRRKAVTVVGAPGGRNCRAGNRGRYPARSRPAPKFEYQPALDGLRALAVLGVLLYHAGVSWAPGGFLGVDTFFVLSGFLITSLLVDEWRKRGRIDFRAFWARRARRLASRARPGRHRRRRVRAVRRPPGRARADPRRHVRLLAVRRQLASALRGVVLRSALDAVPATAHLVARHRGAVVPRVAPRPRAHPARDRRSPLGGDWHHGRARDRVGGAHGGALRPRRRPFTRVLRHRHARPGPAPRRGARACSWRVRGSVRAGDGRDPRATPRASSGSSASGSSPSCTWAGSGRTSPTPRRGCTRVASWSREWRSQRSSPPPLARTRRSSGRCSRSRPLRAIGWISYGLYLWHWPVYVYLTPARTGLDGTAAARRPACSHLCASRWLRTVWWSSPSVTAP